MSDLPSVPARAVVRADDATLEQLLRTPEPWPRTVWAAAKAGVLAGATYSGLMSLMGEATNLVRGGLLFGTFSALAEVARRRSRTGEMFPASLLLIGGVAVGAVGALVTGAATIEGARDMQVVGAVFIVAGAASVLLGTRARRAERERERNLAAAPDPAKRVPRAELMRRVEEQRIALEPWNRRMTRLLLAGVGTFAAVLIGSSWSGIEDRIPDWVGGAIFAGFWAMIGGSLWWSSRVTRQHAARFGTTCPGCERPLFGGLGSMRLLKLFEETGICPQCGAKVVED